MSVGMILWLGANAWVTRNVIVDRKRIRADLRRFTRGDYLRLAAVLGTMAAMDAILLWAAL